jgi:hypothetical protein
MSDVITVKTQTANSVRLYEPIECVNLLLNLQQYIYIAVFPAICCCVFLSVSFRLIFISFSFSGFDLKCMYYDGVARGIFARNLNIFSIACLWFHHLSEEQTHTTKVYSYSYIIRNTVKKRKRVYEHSGINKSVF